MTSVYDSASVTVSEPVDGTPQLATRGPGQRPNTSRATVERVDPAVMAAAQRVMRPGQRIVVVSPREVRVVNL